MTAHRSLADSELHTPKGADSATFNQYISANGDGTTSFAEFLRPLATWDYATDGATGTISFTGYSNYVVLMLEIFNLRTASSSNLDLKFAFDGNNSFANGYILDGSSTKEQGQSMFVGKLLDASDTSSMCTKITALPVGFNFGKTISYSGFADTSQFYGLGYTDASVTKTGIILTNSGSQNFTGGTVYLYGIRG